MRNLQVLRRMLREHHVTADWISSEGSYVLPLSGIYLISESVLCPLSSGYTADSPGDVSQDWWAPTAADRRSH